MCQIDAGDVVNKLDLISCCLPCLCTLFIPLMVSLYYDFRSIAAPMHICRRIRCVYMYEWVVWGVRFVFCGLCCTKCKATAALPHLGQWSIFSEHYAVRLSIHISCCVCKQSRTLEIVLSCQMFTDVPINLKCFAFRLVVCAIWVFDWLQREIQLQSSAKV